MCTKIKYSFLKETDFYTFFNLSEVKAEKIDDSDILRIFLKPGGFQDHIDINFMIKSDDIFQAQLKLDRAWIGDSQNINPFGKDIAKSFLEALIPPEVNKEFKIFLVQSIWNLRGESDKIICIYEAVRSWESSDPGVKEFLEVYRGIKEISSLKLEDYELIMKNVKNPKLELILLMNWF